LTDGRSQPKKVNFTRFSGVFRLRGGSSTSKDSLEITFPDSTFLHSMVRIGLALISQGTAKEASILFFASSG
jgi:hypothetical protein